MTRRAAAIAVATLVAAILVVAQTANAIAPAEVENPRTTRSAWVTDQGGVLSPQAVTELNGIADALQRKNGSEIAVVTVDSTGDLTPKQFATELFNLWKIGQKGRDNGVLVLIVVHPHRIEVETGYGAEAVLPDGRVGRILDREVIPHFRNGDWDGGTVGGVREMARLMAGETRWTDRLPTPEQALPWTALGTAGFVALGGLLLREKLRTRFCPKCRRRMRLLSPKQETPYLSQDELFEEELRSVNHMVWRCDDCQTCRIEHRIHWFSSFADCPKCHRRTLATRTRTVVAPTYVRTGESEVQQACKRDDCGYMNVVRRLIPKLVVETSSRSGGSGGSGGSSGGGGGGGSFGGGSSGGGGSGRSW